MQNEMNDSHGDREILYLTDPMCSWCWGFWPVIQGIREKFGDSIPVRIVLGGLRPGTKEPMTQEIKDFVLHHWEEVQDTTGQDFNFAFDMPDDFRYDTEPACRAVVTVRRIQPDDVFRYFHRLQEAFYLDNRDVTDPEVLAAEAAEMGVDRERFRRSFEDPELVSETRSDFVFSANLGIRGFPSMVLRHQDEYRLLTIGYRSFDILDSRLEEWVAETA